MSTKRSAPRRSGQRAGCHPHNLAPRAVHTPRGFERMYNPFKDSRRRYHETVSGHALVMINRARCVIITARHVNHGVARLWIQQQSEWEFPLSSPTSRDASLLFPLGAAVLLLAPVVAACTLARIPLSDPSLLLIRRGNITFSPSIAASSGTSPVSVFGKNPQRVEIFVGKGSNLWS